MPALCIRIVGNTNTQTLGKHKGIRVTVIAQAVELFRAIDTDKTKNAGVVWHYTSIFMVIFPW